MLVALSGSQAYGTARDGSDVDLRGVCLSPLRSRLSLFETFEQYSGPLDPELWRKIQPKLSAMPTTARAMSVKVESTLFELAKFLRLCAAANPNALEILFTDERDWLYASPLWRKLWTERRAFLSQKVQETYLGYAMAQLKRIRTHRAWLFDPPLEKPKRADFGLPERGTLNREELLQIERSIAEQFQSMAELSSEVIQTLEAERKYRNALRHWESYATWKAERNQSRAELEARFGFDTKHGMHLIRLMRTGLELLQTGELLVRRSDAEELNAIRDGALSYDELVEHAETLRQRMQGSKAESSLPESIDQQRVDELAFELFTAEQT
jgi:predicted nucleotidyltransferase